MATTEQQEQFGPPTICEMASAIESSGYLLEGRVAKLMADLGFFVESNAFLNDPRESDRAIEIDVSGGCFEWIDESNKDTVSASIQVECKNNSLPFAFFVQPQQLPELNVNRIRYQGFPAFSADPETGVRIPLHNLLEMKDWHRYCQTREVATQFCSFTRPNPKKRELRTEAMEHYSRSFSNLSVVSAVGSQPFALDAECIQVELIYPVVVFQGPLYKVHDDGGKSAIHPVERLQFHHSATIGERVVLAQIDLVTLGGLPALLDDILNELRICRDRVKELYPRLLNSAKDQKMAARNRAVVRQAIGVRRDAASLYSQSLY